MLAFRLPADDHLQFFWPDVDTRSGERVYNLDVPAQFTPRHVEDFAQVAADMATGKAVKTYSHFIKPIRATFVFMKENPSVDFPPRDWDDFFDTFFESHLHNKNLGSYKTRISYWQGISNLFETAKSYNLLPSHIVIPSTSVRRGIQSEITKPLTSTSYMVSPPFAKSELLPKKYLANGNLHLQHDEYLLKLKEQMTKASDGVHAACTEYWESMRKCHAIGKSLIAAIPHEEVVRVLETEDFHVNGRHRADPDSPMAINWILAVARHYAIDNHSLSQVSVRALKKTPFFRGVFQNQKRVGVINLLKEAAAGYVVEQPTANETFNRLLGFLSPRDCAVACAILIKENPKFTPDAVANCRLYTQNGKFYLRSETELSRITFSVTKPRAGKRKESALSPQSISIMTDVIECTKDLRNRLLVTGHQGWRKLFIVSTRAKIGTSGDVGQSLIGKSGVSVYESMREKLVAAGINKGNFSLGSIRATEGILRFLTTGSIQAVADLLGNSPAVVKSNYIPEWLRYRWDTRGIRMMQQKLIVVATDGTPWEVLATDMNNAAERDQFIRNMFLKTRLGDAFSELVNAKFGKTYTSGEGLIKAVVDRELMVVLSPARLAALYRLENNAKGSEFSVTSELNSAQNEETLRVSDDEKIYVSNTALIELSKMIRKSATMDYDTGSAADRIIADKISGDSFSQFKAMHKSAQEMISNYKDAKVSIDAHDNLGV